MLERATTAREAIRIGRALVEKYGWSDVGEALTIADPKEVWVMEIVGVGEEEVAAVRGAGGSAPVLQASNTAKSFSVCGDQREQATSSER